MLISLLNLMKFLLVLPFTRKQKNYSTWVFSSSYNLKFNYNSKYLFEYIINNEHFITPLFVINDYQLRLYLQEKYGEKYFIETKSFKGLKRVLDSGVWFTSAGLPVYGYRLNKSRLIINLWHGVPLKKIVLKDKNNNKIKRFFLKYIFSTNYTHVLTTSSSLISIMSKSFNVNESKIKVWGQPRNDCLFYKNDKKMILNQKFRNLPEFDNIILYAPTFRHDKSTVLFPFADFNINELNKYLEDEKLIIFIREHQAEKKVSGLYKSDRIQFLNEDKIKDVMEIINIFDLLITDYSSIFIDYLITEKPVLFLPYDKNDYLNNRGFNFDYNKITPGPKPLTLHDFKYEISTLLNSDTYYKQERIQVKKYLNEVETPCASNIIKEIKDEVFFIKEKGKVNEN